MMEPYVTASGVNIVWKFEDRPDDEFPFVLMLDIKPINTRTIPSTMTRVNMLKAATEIGVIDQDWTVEDYYFVWKFKTEGVRMVFALKTAGAVED